MTKFLASLVCALVCATSLAAQTSAPALQNRLDIIAPLTLLPDMPVRESSLKADGDMCFCIAADEAEVKANRLRFEFDSTFSGWQEPGVSIDGRGDDASADDAAQVETAKAGGKGFRWRTAMRQSLLFLAVQHGYAMTQPKTRLALKGPFFRDYARSVKSLHGWADGGKFFTNYIAHPMQGSFMGFIQIQNDPKGMKQKFGASGDYWKSRLKAMAWSAAWSTQFEVGPISQASIGNVGENGKQTYVDIVITPTVGTAMLVTEDALDRYIIERIERGTDNFYIRIGSRMVLNPTRTIANLFRFKKPWHRDRLRAH